ncbi:LysR family transcriptional regulator [Paracoccus sp. MBLB3053]|uniref:LysR family transcriptional regulator n=1 Tax=Paracoccus aurantius TaxID=3073814 RepID=A0ABU2HW00_9RHOB|nr:LysR family transcriptional regulator [Paracoccus sp. MBLB3053]MDS9469237.1 LysR family transcriptional regulator [Paracoccus sp. MBLB3053]
MKPIPFGFRQIDYLLAVAQTGSTAAAARALNVSQPSISVAIAQFEAHFGAALFIRLPGQGMKQTPYGRDRIARLRNLRTEADSIFGTAGDTPQQLRLGVFSTLGPRYAPMLMRRFAESCPGATLDFVEGDIGSLGQAILAGELDLALVYDVGLPAGLVSTELAAIPPCAVLPPEHRLADRTTIDLRDLAEDPLIMIGLPHSRGYFLSLFQMAGARPAIAAETGSIEMLRALVANGHGVGLLATELPYEQTYDGRRVVMRSLAGPLPPSRVVLVRAARFEPTEAMTRFTQIACETLQGDVAA